MDDEWASLLGVWARERDTSSGSRRHSMYHFYGDPNITD